MSLQETFLAFAAKTRTDWDVMRAIMNYEQWQAPADYAMDALKTNMFDRIAVWGNGTPTPNKGALWLFSDDAAANAFVNRGGHAGPFASPIRGWKLFENLPDTITSVEINPGSPVQNGWFISKDGFALTRLWAKVAELEHYVQTMGDGFINAMLDFPAFSIFVLPNGAMCTAVGAAGMKNPGMLFTAPDCADVVQKEAGPAGAQFRRLNVSGRDVFARFDRLGVDGLLINPRGPGPARALNLNVCKIIIESMGAAK